jgi:hypothetical protein
MSERSERAPQHSEDSLKILERPELRQIAKRFGINQNFTSQRIISLILTKQGNEQRHNGDRDASQADASRTEDQLHQQVEIIRPGASPSNTTASISSTSQPLPAAVSPAQILSPGPVFTSNSFMDDRLPRTRTVSQAQSHAADASITTLLPPAASTRTSLAGGGRACTPRKPAAVDYFSRSDEVPTVGTPESQRVSSPREVWSPINYGNPPPNPKNPSLEHHAYKALVINMSGCRSYDAVHISTRLLVQKLEEQMMRSNPRNSDGNELDRKLLWNLGKPGFIFNVTGTADSKPWQVQPEDAMEKFKQDWPELWYFKRLKDYITQVMFGIAAEHKSCWMMDGGTNAGIMSLLGAMHLNHFNKALHSANDFPLIGFSDMSALDRDASFPNFPQFRDGSFDHMKNAFVANDSRRRYKPDPNHTHHVHIHSTGLKCDKSSQHDHHFLLQFYCHLAKIHVKCPIVRYHRINLCSRVFVIFSSCQRYCWWRYWIVEKYNKRFASRGKICIHSVLHCTSHLFLVRCEKLLSSDSKC